MGFNKNYNKDLIKSKTYEIKKGYKFLQKVKKTLTISTNDEIIVGIKIIPKKDHNGKWEIEENPLLNYEMSIKFTSENTRGINYKMEVYTMKNPEKISFI